MAAQAGAVALVADFCLLVFAPASNQLRVFAAKARPVIAIKIGTLTSFAF